MVDFLSERTPRHYLLIPVMPTPNGRLHLGHVAGPFLKMDILARHLRRGGDNALLISGTDPHDSFVLLKAHQTNQTPEQTANYFHDLIFNDLRSLDILPDAFINPLQPEWSERYTWLSIDTVGSLIKKGVTEIRRERFLYCPTSDRYIVGCWLLGKCPACGSDVCGYFCEECDMHFRPEMLEDPRSRLDEGALEWREVSCLYLRLSATEPLFSRMAAMGLPDEFQQIVRQHIATQGR